MQKKPRKTSTGKSPVRRTDNASSSRGVKKSASKPDRKAPEQRERRGPDAGDKRKPSFTDSRNQKGKRGYSRREPEPYFEKPAEEKKPKRLKKWEIKKQEREEARDAYRSRTQKYDKRRPSPAPAAKKDGLMRLNKYLSMAGIASRRDADQLIQLGLVKVNNSVVTELGYKVDPQKDVVKYDDKSIKPEKFRYVLLNKPKDYITTMDDPEERKTVMWLVRDACKERIYPVGRLDRQTTGLLLFTNDGELAKKLTHPKHGYQKIYHVETLEKIKGTDLDKIREGVELEDGFVKADDISLVNDDPRQVGIRLHSGRNRIVRRIFEHFNYTVKKLDRVSFAGLTKKDLPRGRYRHLTEQEVNFLKMIR